MYKYWVDLFTKILFLYCLFVVGWNAYSVFNSFVKRNPLVPDVLYKIALFQNIFYLIIHSIIGYIALALIAKGKEDKKFLIVSMLVLLFCVFLINCFVLMFWN